MKVGSPGDQPLSKAEIRTLADKFSLAHFGVPADKLPSRLTSGSTGESAEARRIALVARYAQR